MKPLNNILVLFAFISFPFYSQEDFSKLTQSDSTELIKTDAFFNLSHKFEKFKFYKNLVDSNSSKLWLKASMEMGNKSPFGKENDLTPSSLHSSLYEQYLEKSKFNALKTALGIIQASVAGYLAYRHIKKWVLKK
jgi:hypothetical protein